jgi:probable F420-dependent oxidoreductase
MANLERSPFTRPFRFGVQASNSDRDWMDFAREVESLGYSSLSMPDHFVDTHLAPVVGLTAAACATSTLRIGALVFDNDYKHPAILAKEMATLDVISGGRVEFGIGAGWMRSDYDALGLQYDSPGVRVDRMVEALDVIAGCFSEGAFSFHGVHYAITEYDALPKPVQPGGPPILIGGGGKRVLSIAAQRAHIVGINPNLRAGAITADAAQDAVADMTQQKVAWIRNAAGDRFAELELQTRVFLCAVTDDRNALAEAMAPAFGIAPDEALRSHAVLAGTVDELVEQCLQRRTEYGISYVVVGDDVFRDFAPVVAQLTGQ